MTPDAPTPTAAGREWVLVTGMSGAGKSIALHALEDAGFFCVDNLPPELLPPFMALEVQREPRRVAIAVDVRSKGSLPHLLPLLKQLQQDGHAIRSLFLDASDDALLRRFSETRRPHPLQDREALAAHAAAPDGALALLEAVALERECLATLRVQSSIVDTSLLRPAQLRTWVRDWAQAPGGNLTLIFESFAFKAGVPRDADYVFDVRILPNPYYVPELRAQTGRDEPVARYLEAQPEVQAMKAQLLTFLQQWLPAFVADHRSYLTVAIGCTGGQHRSVYLVEALACAFAPHGRVLKRHRELDAR